MTPVNDESAPKGAPETSWRRSSHRLDPNHRDRPTTSPTPRQVAFKDQAAAAAADAMRTLHRVAEVTGKQCTFARPSPWISGLLEQAIAGRRTCKHLRRATPGVVFLAAHRRRIECETCAGRAARAVIGTREDRTCDLCRREIEPGQVFTVMCAIGAVLVTAGHCAACATAVRGQAGRSTRTGLGVAR